MPLSKSGLREGRQESLALDDPWVVALVQGYISRLPRDAFLSRVSPDEQRNRLWRACTLLGIDFGFRWYSVRRGGATDWFQRTDDVHSLLLRGRWNAVRTAKIYVEDARAKLAELVVPERGRLDLEQRAGALRPDYAGCAAPSAKISYSYL